MYGVCLEFVFKTASALLLGSFFVFVALQSTSPSRALEYHHLHLVPDPFVKLRQHHIDIAWPPHKLMNSNDL